MSEEQELIRGEVYDATVKGVDWIIDALYIGIRKFSPRFPRGHLVTFRDSEGLAELKGFTGFTLKGDKLIMKHAYTPKISNQEREYLEERLKKAGL